MFAGKSKEKSCKKAARKNRAAEIVNLLESLITALIPALIIVTFVVRPFIIPTGSMADTLKGAHFRLRCSQCGYKYDRDLGAGNHGLSYNSGARKKFNSMWSRCPSCGYHQSISGRTLATRGDVIFVLKCIYQFCEPKRWDVVVFKHPLEPQINLIKRLIGRPGEKVEIIDGDVYIDGEISRKPPKIQEELWMPVYDNDYQPARPHENLFNGHTWRQPFDFDNSQWSIYKDNPTKFELNSPADVIGTLRYDSTIGNDFRATYAYNDVRRYKLMPNCSDLKVRFYAESAGQIGQIGIALSKYEINYKAWFESATSDMVIVRSFKGQKPVELARRHIDLVDLKKGVLVEFANVDHQLIFQLGTTKLTYDLGPLPDDAGQRKADIEPEVEIFGSGKITLRHVAIFRDIHYTNPKYVNGAKPHTAIEGNPIKLESDEFFMLGDNSPVSGDSRLWSKQGIGNNGISYRRGVVPREYLVGKAWLVFWPSGFKPFAKFPFAIIPDIGQMRFIYGGSSKTQ